MAMSCGQIGHLFLNIKILKTEFIAPYFFVALRCFNTNN